MKLEWEVENKGALDVSAEGEFERLTKGDRRFSDAEREGVAVAVFEKEVVVVIDGEAEVVLNGEFRLTPGEVE